MKIAAIIPARFASTRFPGKPLALIAGKPMILHVLERVSQIKSLATVCVATDDERIFQTVEKASFKAIMTSREAATGTDRLAEACLHPSLAGADYLINVQGDEPLITGEHLEGLLGLLDGKTELATLRKAISESEEITNPNVVKVVINAAGEALYFSRHPIPYLRGVEGEQWSNAGLHYKHIGLYAYRRDVLLALSTLPPSPLEQAESLEQLRWLEAGYRIKVATSTRESIGVDTPGDLEKVERMLHTGASKEGSDN
jgi:3-deoxy-manno-octulosonate cytidylyltransferase (CMP-KDO synthetase)